MVGSNETPVDETAMKEIEGNEAVQRALAVEEMAKAGYGPLVNEREQKRMDKFNEEMRRKMQEAEKNGLGGRGI